LYVKKLSNDNDKQFIDVMAVHYRSGRRKPKLCQPLITQSVLLHISVWVSTHGQGYSRSCIDPLSPCYFHFSIVAICMNQNFLGFSSPHLFWGLLKHVVKRNKKKINTKLYTMMVFFLLFIRSLYYLKR
jgi:hypothetical protein